MLCIRFSLCVRVSISFSRKRKNNTLVYMCHLYIFFAMKELVSFLSSLVSRLSKCTSEKKTRKRTRAREQYDEEEKVDRGGFALFFLKFRVLVLFLCFCWCGNEPAFAGETRLFALRRRTSPAARRERACEIVSRGLSRTRATSLLFFLFFFFSFAHKKTIFPRLGKRK